MRILNIVIALLVLFVLPLQAHASFHRGVYEDLGKETGIYIAPLIHPQMVVIYKNHGDILAMARKHADDPILGKMLEGEFEQRAWAGFGLIPVDVADADQVLHLPTHGYLAHTRAMLVRLQEMAPAGSPEIALADRIERQMVMDEGTSLSLCEYSATPFNTNTPVGPDWSKFPTSRASAIAFTLMVASFAGTTAWRRNRKVAAA